MKKLTAVLLVVGMAVLGGACASQVDDGDTGAAQEDDVACAAPSDDATCSAAQEDTAASEPEALICHKVCHRVRGRTVCHNVCRHR